MIVECPACNTIFPVDPKKVPTDGIDARCSVCSEVFFVAPSEPEAEIYEAEVEGIEPEVKVSEPYVEKPAFEEEMPPIAEVEVDAPVEVEAVPEPEVGLEAEPEPAFEIEREPSFEEREVSFGTEVEPPLKEDFVPVPPEPVFESAEATFEKIEETAGESAEEFQENAVEVGEGIFTAMDTETTEAAEAEVVEEVTGAVEEVLEGPTISAPVFGRRNPTEKAQRLARVLVSDIILYNPDRHHTATETGRVKEEFEEEIQKSWSEYVEQVGDEIANSTPYFSDALNEILAKGQKIF